MGQRKRYYRERGSAAFLQIALLAERDTYAGKKGAAFPCFLHRLLIGETEVFAVNHFDIIADIDTEDAHLESDTEGATHVAVERHLRGHILVTSQLGETDIEHRATEDEHVGMFAQWQLKNSDRTGT